MNRAGVARPSAAALAVSLGLVTIAAAQRGPASDGVMSGQPPAATLRDGLADLSRGPGSVHGYITDRERGTPITDVTVQLTLYGQVAGQPGRRALARRTIRVDDRGFYRFDSVSYGQYLLSVVTPGYSDSGGRFSLTSGSASTVLSAAQPSAVVPFRFSKVSTFDGVVRDASGTAAPGVVVQAFRRLYDHDRFVMQDVPVTATTGADGRYRFTNVPPGEYMTCVTERTITMPTAVTDAYRAVLGTPDEARWIARLGESDAPVPGALPLERGLHVGSDDVWRIDAERQIAVPTLGAGGTIEMQTPACHPDTRDVISATLRSIAPGADVHGIDIRLDRQLGVRLAGHLVGAPDLVGRVGLHLRRTGNESILHTIGFDEAQTVTDDQGRFGFLGVSPGRYVIHAEVSGFPSVPGMTWNSGVPYGPDGRFILRELRGWAASEVEVRSDAVEDVAVPFLPPRSVSGRVVMIHDSPRSTSNAEDILELTWLSLTGRTPSAHPVAKNGQLAISGEAGGRFLLSGPSAPEWMVRSMTANGRDILDRPVDLSSGNLDDIVVTMTNRLTVIEGVVRLPSGGSAVDADVLIFPVDFAGWLARSSPMHQAARVRADADGRYELSGLPTGDYVAVALPPGGADDWPDERLIAAAVLSPAAKRFRLDSGPIATQSLIAAPIGQR